MHRHRPVCFDNLAIGLPAEARNRPPCPSAHKRLLASSKSCQACWKRSRLSSPEPARPNASFSMARHVQATAMSRIPLQRGERYASTLYWIYRMTMKKRSKLELGNPMASRQGCCWAMRVSRRQNRDGGGRWMLGIQAGFVSRRPHQTTARAPELHLHSILSWRGTSNPRRYHIEGWIADRHGDARRNLSWQDSGSQMTRVALRTASSSLRICRLLFRACRLHVHPQADPATATTPWQISVQRRQPPRFTPGPMRANGHRGRASIGPLQRQHLLEPCSHKSRQCGRLSRKRRETRCNCSLVGCCVPSSRSTTLSRQQLMQTSTAQELFNPEPRIYPRKVRCSQEMRWTKHH